MRISELIIIILVIAMFSTGFLGFYGALMNANNLTPQNFTGVNNTSSTVTSIRTMHSDISSAQNTTGTSGNIISFAPLNLLHGAYNAVMQAFTLPGIFVNIIGELTSSITGWPRWASDSMNAIIMIIVISALIYLIIGRKF